MTDERIPKPDPPDHLGAAGRDLWATVGRDLVFEAHELPLLTSACEVADRIAALEAVIAEEGVTVAGSKGQPRLHPAVAEVRQSRLAMARLLGQIAIETGEGHLANAASIHGRRAATARWRGSPRSA